MTAGLETRSAPERGWDRRRFVYGDWNWLVRDPLDVLRLAFIAGTVAFALMGRSTTVGLTAASVLLLIARVVDLPRWFDFALIVAMTAIAWGTALSLYGEYFFYDKVVHSVAPFCTAPVLYILLVRLDVVPDPTGVHTISRRAGIFVTTLALGLAVGAGYENDEWIEDEPHILGGHFVKGLWDTETDLLCDTGGSLAAAIFLTLWSVRHWSSRRVAVAPATRPVAWSSVAGAFGRLRRSRGVSAWRRRLAQLPLAAKGLIGIVAGTVLLVWPNPALRTVGVVVGLALVAGAAFDLVELVRRGLGRAIAAIVAELACGCRKPNSG